MSYEVGFINFDSIIYNKMTIEELYSEYPFLTEMPLEFRDLNFDYLNQEKLDTVNEKYALENSDYDKYLVIGFNGSGDPIAINLDNKELVYLNHDNHFEEVFINSDMKKFVLSAVRVDDFMEQLEKLNADSVFETEFSDETFDELLQDIKRIDGNVFEKGNGHWLSEFENFKWERDEERR